MKRLTLALIGLGVLVALVAPAAAQAEPKYGLGYFRPEAPVGGRAWLNDKVAADLGVGFEFKKFGSMYAGLYDKADESKLDDEKLAFTIDAGLPFVLAGDETTKFFVRPGVTFASRPTWDVNDGPIGPTGPMGDWASSTEIWISGTLGVEHWFGKHFSIGAGHGLVFKSIDPGVKGSDTSTEIASTDFGISSVGFHFYF